MFVANLETSLDQSPRLTQCSVDNGGITLLSEIEVNYRCFNGVCPPYPTISWRLHWPVKFYNYFMIRFNNGKTCELTLTNIWQYCTGDRCSMVKYISRIYSKSRVPQLSNIYSIILEHYSRPLQVSTVRELPISNNCQWKIPGPRIYRHMRNESLFPSTRNQSRCYSLSSY